MTLGATIAVIGDIAAAYAGHWLAALKKNREEEHATRREMPSIKKSFADEVKWNLMLNRLGAGNRKQILKYRARRLRPEQKADLILSLYEIFREDEQAAIDILDEMARANDSDWKTYAVERELFKSKERLYRWHEARVRLKLVDRGVSHAIDGQTTRLRAATTRHRNTGYEF